MEGLMGEGQGVVGLMGEGQGVVGLMGGRKWWS